MNVTLTGFLYRPETTRYYQQAANVLVSYYSARDHPYAQHNLPNKLAEYMSTGNPAVVADFSAVRDIATPDTAVLVEPDKPAALVDAIARIVSQPAAFSERAQRARALIRERTFERVAGELVDFLRQA
jgi:glycosyltransferase involved in cell wall biosynthesis